MSGHLVGGNVVVILERLLVALDRDGVLLAAVPPVGDPHPALAHLPPLRPRHLAHLLLLLEVQEAEEVGDPGVRGDVGLPAQGAVRQVGLDGHDGQLVLVHRLNKVELIDRNRNERVAETLRDSKTDHSLFLLCESDQKMTSEEPQLSSFC